MKVIGLTGGIATGKSEVTRILRKLNIPVFDADAAVHTLYQNGVAAKALKNICPDAVEGQRINRRKISELILKQPVLLKKIEAIIHPLVRKSEKDFLSDAAHSSEKIVVIDSPLLIETGHYKNMDFSVLIATTKQNQKLRALARPNMTKEKIELLLAKQMPTEEKRKLVDLVIENNGTLEELEQKIRSTFQKLLDS